MTADGPEGGGGRHLAPGPPPGDPVARGLTDLASRALGGSVMAASDESFGEKECLLVPGPPVVDPGRYGHKGELVDGWETRRQRSRADDDAGVAGPHDWALIRLGAPGVVQEMVVDTTGFTGNQPPVVAVDAVRADPHARADALLADDVPWVPLVPPSPALPDRPNTYPVLPDRGPDDVVTHLRLRIMPDGGVARLRALGRIVPDLTVWAGLPVNLLAAELGARVVEQSDGFYSGAGNLLLPGPARTMAEGWEARRLRSTDPDRHDHVVLETAVRGVAEVLEVDTRWFVANASDTIAVLGHPGPAAVPGRDDPGWVTLLARTPLAPDAPHRWRLPWGPPVRYVRLEAYPDGGLSRVRLWGMAART